MTRHVPAAPHGHDPARAAVASGRRPSRSLAPVVLAAACAVALPTTAHAASPAAAPRTVVLGAQPASAPWAGSGSRAATPRIVGGQAVTIASVPYQVRIRARSDGQAFEAPGGFSYSTCGGAVIDATHVVTAAHCTFQGTAQLPPNAFRIDTGSSRFDATSGSGGAIAPVAGDTPQARSASVVRRHPSYRPLAGDSGALEDLTDDVAVLTLSQPLAFDANTAPVALAAPGPSPVGTATVSGFGIRSQGGAQDGNLYRLDTPLADAAVSEQDGGAGPLNALYAVSRSPNGSTCQGDSGGPLVQAGKLIGIVSSGPSCGAGSPSYYTNVAAPEVQAFIQGNDNPPVAPRGGDGVALRAPAAPRTGDTLTCSPGSWSGAPSFVYSFVDTRNGKVLASSASATYELTPDDAGATVQCRVSAVNAGGTGRTLPTSATAAVAAGPRPALTVRATGASSVRRGRTLALRVVVRNPGGPAAADVRTCVRVGSRFTVVSRGGGTLKGTRLCWSTASVPATLTKRFSVRAKRTARTGRTVVAKTRVTAKFATTATANRRVTIRR